MKKKLLNYIALHQKPILLVLFLASLIYPLFGQNIYIMRITVVALMYISLTLSFNLLSGYMGQFSMAHAGFYGIGAYSVGILTKHVFSIPVFPAMLIGMAVAGIVSLFLAIPTLRLKGSYLSIVTMGFAEIVKLIEINQVNLTNGQMGIMNIPKLKIFGFTFTSPMHYYFLMLGITILFTYVIKAILDSRIGRAVLSIREDDIAADAMGIHVFKYKVMIFIISTMMAGLVGGFYAVYTTFIDPSSFSQEISVRIMSMSLLGGLGSLPGCYIGAIVLAVLPEVTRGLSTYRYLIYGAIIVITMLFLPNGLMGKINFKYMKQQLTLENTENGKNTAKGDKRADGGK